MCVKHGPIQTLLGLLLDELRSDNASGRLYADSLVHLLTMQYLTARLAGRGACNMRASALPQRILKRVQERIEADLEADLSLETLAEESGYSRAHFLRMFQAATGVTPHQYVIDLRLRRAQEYLRQKDASIIDVALSCGFSSQSHMTSVFRQRLNTTPGDYRRNA
jgi:AraC family transcriptional regulator